MNYCLKFSSKLMCTSFYLYVLLSSSFLRHLIRTSLTDYYRQKGIMIKSLFVWPHIPFSSKPFFVIVVVVKLSSTALCAHSFRQSRNGSAWPTHVFYFLIEYNNSKGGSYSKSSYFLLFLTKPLNFIKCAIDKR